MNHRTMQRRTAVTAGVMALTFAVCAHADTLIATHPGLMCASSEALAKLTLPDGSSRTADPNASAQDQRIKQAGNCIDIPSGAHVTLLTARKNTSIVTYRPNRQPAETMIVPNVDFTRNAEAASSAGAGGDQGAELFFTTVERTCPQQGWTGNIIAHQEQGPIDSVYATMSATQKTAAGTQVDAACSDSGGVACPSAAAISYMVNHGYLARMIRATCAQKAPSE